jgi:hypothetical protein
VLVQFVTDLSDRYARILSSSQPNSSFELGELISNGEGSAVHMFLAAFDSLAGPQVRFISLNTTAYCGQKDSAVPMAVEVARRNGAVVKISSNRSQDAVSEGATRQIVPSWLIVVVTLAGAMLENLLVFK